MSMPPPATDARRVAAEALGTALLLATVVGSGIMGERLAGGNVAHRAARQHARDRRGAGRADPHVRPGLGRALQPGRHARRRVAAAALPWRDVPALPRGAGRRRVRRRRRRAHAMFERAAAVVLSTHVRERAGAAAQRVRRDLRAARR